MVDISKLNYLESHEWVSVDGNTGTVGLSDYAQKEISDVVYVELPKVGDQVSQKKNCMVVESVKAAFDIYSPVSGKVVEVNDKLKDSPQLVNESPYDEAWLFKVELSNPDELKSLIDASTYENQKEKAH